MKKKLALILAAVTALSMVGFAMNQPKSAHVKKDKVSAVRSKGSAKMPGEAKFAKDKSSMASPKAKSKGGSHDTHLHIDNRSAYYVYIYLDDEYIGSVSPYGDSYAWEPSGDHKVYGVSSGGTVSWGPKYYYFERGADFTWTID